MNLTRVLADRFWEKVGVRAADECWLWQAGKGYDGYGRFNVEGKTALAHRVAYALWYGKLPQGVVMHSCDTHACCNPRHLKAGSQGENMADKWTKGRGVLPPTFRGERHPQAELSDRDIRRIREDYAAGRASQTELAARHNASQVWIGQVVRGERRLSAGGPLTVRGRGNRSSHRNTHRNEATVV